MQAKDSIDTMLIATSIDNSSNNTYELDDIDESNYDPYYYNDLLLLIILSTLFVLFSTYIDIRKTITSYLWWKIQFMLHPILVGIGVYYGIIHVITPTSNDESATTPIITTTSSSSSTTSRMIVMTILSLFVFNFGIGPHQMPFSDLIFRGCFYIHHIAPLFTCCKCMSPLLVTASYVSPLYTKHHHQYQQQQHIMLDHLHYHHAMSSAIIFGYLWIVHPMTALHRFKIINKENWFYPYIFGEFLSLLYYTWSLLGMLLLVVENEAAPLSPSSMTTTTISRRNSEEGQLPTTWTVPIWFHLIWQTFIYIFPLALQYVGRWGLYVRVMQLLNWPKQNEPFYDWFGQTKQIWEFGSIILSTTIIVLGYLVGLVHNT